MKSIIDTHTHLDEILDVPSLLASCASLGVGELIVAGTDLKSNQRHCDIRKQHVLASPRIHLALGLHPGNIVALADTEDCLCFIREHIHEAIAVGEMGLDYHYKWVKEDEDKKCAQKDVFARQLAMAKEFDRPAIIHSRGAYRDALTMAKASGVKKANFHWYTGPIDVLKDILDAGFFVCVSPSLEYSPEARAVAEFTPFDRILVETDTPVRGWKPMDVWRTLKLLSALKGVAEEELLVVVNRNAQAFFSL
ncbi:MAG: TatD family hydrolase [Candidatus Omnitrophica bacterium]|nr:TatD family hydrolase [Candidatus Omnitrophota bacterium]